MSDKFQRSAKLNEKRDKFKKKVEKLLPDELISKMEKLDSKEKCLTFANEVIEEAKTSKDEIALKRLHGFRRAGVELEKLQVSFAEFLGSYSGIVEIVKTAGGQYGSLAYSAVSLLLVVAVNKSLIEEKLDSALKSFGTEFPRIAELKELINDATANARFDEVLADVVKLAYEATLYYRKSCPARYWYVIIHPPARLDKLRESITAGASDIKEAAMLWSHRNVKQIREQSDKLLEHNQQLLKTSADLKKRIMTLQAQNHQMVQKIEQLNVENAGLRGQVEESRQLHDQEILEDVKVYLNTEDVPEDLVQRYETDLRFPRVSNKYRRFQFHMLSSCEQYHKWWDSQKSVLLILDGHSLKAGSDNSDRFWASTAAFDLLKILRDSQSGMVLHYFIELEESMIHDVPSHKIFSHLIWQILKHGPYLVRNTACMQELKSLASNANWQAEDPRDPCKIIRNLVDHVSSTYIVLDRIDRCNCHLTVLIERLLWLLAKSKNTVKIFTTLGERSSKIVDLKKFDDNPQFTRVTLNQTKRRADPMIDV